MRRRGRLGLLAVLVLCAATVVSVAAWGEVTLWQDGGEAQWWYIGKHPEVCGTPFVDACQVVVDPITDLMTPVPYGNQWNVELAAYHAGDLAQVSLNSYRWDPVTETGFQFVEVDGPELKFSYKMLLNSEIGTPPSGSIESNSGPRLAFWLVDVAGLGEDYLVISSGAPVTQTGSCGAFSPQVASDTWWWGAVETGTTDDGKDYVDVSSLTRLTLEGYGTLSAAQSAYGLYEVKAVLVVMGVVGELDPSVVVMTSTAIAASAAKDQKKVTVPLGSGILSGDHVFIADDPLWEINEVGTVAVVGGQDVLTMVANLRNAYTATGTVGVGEPIGAGQALVDNVVLEWNSGANGGTYGLEREWGVFENDVLVTTTLGFDDWTSTPPTDTELPPREWSKWCTNEDACPHCLLVDDQNLWTIVKETDFPLTVPTAARTFPSGDYAIYFGTKSVGNYDRGEAAVGTVCSPWNELNPADKYVSLSFDYFRQVESYMGKYDWTYVQIMFDTWEDLPWDPFAPADASPGDAEDCPVGSGNNWKTVWYKDSSDPSTGQWEQAVITHYLDADNDPYTDEAQRILIPPTATRMRIRFGFNSVDGASNNYLGWIIDNVQKTHSPEPSGCRIITEHLPQGEVGQKYGVYEEDIYVGYKLFPQVLPDSTTGPRRWSIVSITKDGERLLSLPRRLALDPSGRLYGEFDPGTSGTYTITFRLECRDGRPEEKTFVLNVRAPQTDMEGVLFYQMDFEQGTGDNWTWPESADTCPNLWQQTNFVHYALESGSEYSYVAYFGKDRTEDPNYSCARAKGYVTSPTINITEAQDGEELVIGFKSWRNVESFAGGEYDKTWVEVRPAEGGNWVVVWSKSSKDASLAEWTWEEVRTGILLKEGKKIQVRFGFDSIDGYRNGKDGEAYGWLVDEISLYAGGPELAITACPRVDTSVGENYNEEIRVSGGSDIDPKWEISAGALPPGIGLVEDSTDGRKAFISGVARTTGTYSFTIRVRDNLGSNSVATRACTIVVGSNVALLFEDFENDPAWGGTGLWHYTTDAGVKGVDDLNGANHAAYYGRDDGGTPNYSTGARTDGMLTLVTPVISLTGVVAVRVECDYWREVENFGNGGYDKTYVQVKLGDGDWHTIWERDSGDACVDEWISEEAISPFLTGGATTMLIRFVFDSVDRWYNNYVGWLVDNIKIESAPTTGATPVSVMRIESGRSEERGTPAELQVINVPNPVTDVHTTTFMVRSPDVEAMRIRIFDLAGSLVYEEEISSNELVWHTENNFGEYLANGIYLYRASVLINGEWVETTVQKLVILR
jgi:hypothetical protein